MGMKSRKKPRKMKRVKTRKKTPEKPITNKKDLVIVEEWKGGERISDLAEKYGIKRSRLRRLIQKAVGGKDAFRSLREKGAGGTTEPFGGKRGGGYVAPDDSKVKVIHEAKTSKGWRSEVMYVPAGPSLKSVSKFINPKGVEYVEASGAEPADLIFQSKIPGVPPVRLRKLEGSRVAKRKSKREKQVKEGMEALVRKRRKKAEKRKERKVKRQRRST